MLISEQTAMLHQAIALLALVLHHNDKKQAWRENERKDVVDIIAAYKERV